MLSFIIHNLFYIVVSKQTKLFLKKINFITRNKRKIDFFIIKSQNKNP